MFICTILFFSSRADLGGGVDFGQNRDFLVLWESSEKQVGRPKKKVDKISKIF